MSMISEQIKRLREKADLVKKSGFGVDGIVWEFEEAAKTIEELSAKLHASQIKRSSQYYNGGWIPVKWHEITEDEREREGYPEEWVTYLDCLLPNDGDEILITVRGSNGNVYVEKDECCVDNGYYLDSGHDWTDDVIAWMPLPEPYKEREDGNATEY